MLPLIGRPTDCSNRFPCINTSSIRITMKDLREKFLPYVGHEFRTVDLAWQED